MPLPRDSCGAPIKLIDAEAAACVVTRDTKAIRAKMAKGRGGAGGNRQQCKGAGCDLLVHGVDPWG